MPSTLTVNTKTLVTMRGIRTWEWQIIYLVNGSAQHYHYVVVTSQEVSIE